MEGTRKLECLCDHYELCRDEILHLLERTKGISKDEFIEEYQAILDRYSIVKIDAKDPFKEKAIYMAECVYGDPYEIRVMKCCVEINAIIAEQIRLRNYSLEYTRNIKNKLEIYLNIFERRKYMLLPIVPHVKQKILNAIAIFVEEYINCC